MQKTHHFLNFQIRNLYLLFFQPLPSICFKRFKKRYKFLREITSFSSKNKILNIVLNTNIRRMAQKANSDFSRKNRPDRSNSQELNSFFGHLPRAGRQNRVQNRDFSEKPRWGPYKNHKNVTKNRFARGNCRKNVIFTF